ncbi:MAG TPA: ATPase domain-containing protein [Thermoplasmata archaeon]|nr:ATPase domain-containing protein [Thermoplasmata archaeon]
MGEPPVGKRVKTGIQVLDDRLHGGFPCPSTLLLFSDKPTEKRLFAEHFAVEGARAGETTLYVDFYRAPALARTELSRFGKFPPEQLIIVDAISSQLLMKSEEKYRIADIGSLTGITDTIVDAIRTERPARVVIDSMEFLADRFPKEAVLAEWRRIIQEATATNAVSCFLFINWTYQERDLGTIRAMSDFVVEFQSSMRGGILRNSMRISEMEEDGIRTNWIPYTFKDLTGVTVYFPRIMVTGPFNAGKSTVVKALCEKSISIDRMGTTVAFDYGSVNITGIEAEVFGTPGQERFEFIFRIFAREVSGVLLVVDATRPEDFTRATHMLELIGPRIPYVVLANKSDLPGALDPGAIARKMELPDGTPVIATIATEGQGVSDALLILAEMIIGVR